MKVAVTGASGRIGEHVVGLLSRTGWKVISIDQRQPAQAVDAEQVIALDTRDYESLVRAIDGCDALIHLAAFAGPGSEADHVVHNTNVVSSYNALRAAAEVGIQRVCQASSINAIGGRFSAWPRYDYFPIDEAHPTYAEDPYSLSKWECEQQADAISRGYPGLSIASLRLHGAVDRLADTTHWLDLPDHAVEKHLWGYVTYNAVARACLAGIDIDLSGHEIFQIVAPTTMVETPSLELAAEVYPDVPVRGDLSGNRGFFDCTKANRMLDWSHDAS